MGAFWCDEQTWLKRYTADTKGEWIGAHPHTPHHKLRASEMQGGSGRTSASPQPRQAGSQPSPALCRNRDRIKTQHNKAITYIRQSITAHPLCELGGVANQVVQHLHDAARVADALRLTGRARRQDRSDEGRELRRRAKWKTGGEGQHDGQDCKLMSMRLRRPPSSAREPSKQRAYPPKTELPQSAARCGRDCKQPSRHALRTSGVSTVILFRMLTPGLASASARQAGGHEE